MTAKRQLSANCSLTQLFIFAPVTMKGFILFLLTICCFSCFEQGDCSDISGDVLQVNFYNQSDKKSLTLALDSVKIPGKDTVMYKDKDVTLITLPIDPGNAITSYTLYHNNATTIIEVEYAFKTYALAPDCNAIDLLTITQATATSVQAITIVQPKLTGTLAENVRLYY